MFLHGDQLSLLARLAAIDCSVLGFDFGYSLALFLNLLQLLFTVCLEDLAGFLEALIR